MAPLTNPSRTCGCAACLHSTWTWWTRLRALDRWCYPSQDLLAVITGESRDVVSELLIELESVNVLISEVRHVKGGGKVDHLDGLTA